MAATSPNVTTWQWDAVRYRAAAQLALGDRKDYQIAAQAGITKRQLIRWKQEPAFAALVAAMTGEACAAIKDEAVATKAGRLRILTDMHNKLLAIIEARAARHVEEREWAAGESTGLIVTKETWGEKVNAQEAAVDAGLIKQVIALHDQIALESGQRVPGLTVRHAGRVDHVHRVTPHDHLTVEQLEALEAIALDAYAKEHAG